MNKNIRKVKDAGITLIALVVTIIVLLILAAVTVNIALGNDGLITRSREAKNQHEKSEIIEVAKLDIMSKKLDNGGGITEDDLREVLTSSEFNTQGTVSENEESILDEILTTKDGKKRIYVREIYEGPFEEVNLKQFSISTKANTYRYNYKDGMTWRQWIDSKYNASGEINILTLNVGNSGDKNYLVRGNADAFIYIATDEILDERIREENHIAGYSFDIDRTDIAALSQFNGQSWSSFWDDPAFSNFKNKWKLSLGTNDRIMIDIGASKKYLTANRVYVKTYDTFNSSYLYFFYT